MQPRQLLADHVWSLRDEIAEFVQTINPHIAAHMGGPEGRAARQIAPVVGGQHSLRVAHRQVPAAGQNEGFGIP